MFFFILRRLFQAIPVLLLSTVFIFLLLHLIPGDPALTIVGPDASEEVIEAVREKMGLDRPLVVQYGLWLGNVLRGDLGHSHVNKLPVTELIARRLPATAQLAIAALLLTTLISVPLGILAALKAGSPVDWLVSSFNSAAMAIPNFWLGILAILLFAVTLRWLPPGGRVEFSQNIQLALKAMILPVVTLAVRQIAILTRFMRSGMLDVLHEDYVRTARGKGLHHRWIILRHVFPNALIPVVTVLGIQFGRLFGGAVVIETVFAWPGIGRLIVDSINTRDYTVAQGVFLLLVAIFILVNVTTDIVYGFLDPRLRLAERSR